MNRSLYIYPHNAHKTWQTSWRFSKIQYVQFLLFWISTCRYIYTKRKSWPVSISPTSKLFPGFRACFFMSKFNIKMIIICYTVNRLTQFVFLFSKYLIPRPKDFSYLKYHHTPPPAKINFFFKPKPHFKKKMSSFQSPKSYI